ncbi:MAG TPA: diguanylate cyclase [Firmicutes bacterium]|nr:diguanylate cyclase [Bacillota bacterium]
MGYSKLAGEGLTPNINVHTLQDIIDFFPDATFIINECKRVIVWNKAMEEMTGVQSAEILGKGDYAYAVPFFGEARPIIIDLIDQDDQPTVNRYESFRKEGSKLYGEIYAPMAYRGRGAYLWAMASPFFGRQGNRLGAIQTIRDITHHKKVEQALKDSEERYREILFSIQEGYYEADLTGNIIYCNEAGCRLLGRSMNELIGLNYRQIFKDPNTAHHAFHRVYLSGKPGRGAALEVVRHDGATRVNELSISLMKDKRDRITGFRVVARDITERINIEQRLRYLCLHDQLTDLYNRTYFEEELHRLENGRDYPITIVSIDVDNLKITNDLLGHGHGDELLRTCARILQKPLRRSDILARVGGDEFALILPRADQKKAEAVCNRIRKAVEEHNSKHPNLQVSISMGSATSHGPEEPLQRTLIEADDCMYREKLIHGAGTLNQIMDALISTLESRDYFSQGHASRLRRFCQALGQTAGLSARQLRKLTVLSQVHDLGKVSIPETILHKAGPLTGKEWKIVKQHSEKGYRIARISPELLPVADFILHHHEHWDGQGYPLGLAGDKIPLECRIFAIAEAFEVMTSDRPYRPARSTPEAIAELKGCAGTQFDPELIKLFVPELEGENDTEECL